MQLIVTSDGGVRCVYSEIIDLTTLGRLSITRGSRVEPNSQGLWGADLAPVGGPLLGPFLRRSDALEAEAQWLADRWLIHQPTK